MVKKGLVLVSFIVFMLLLGCTGQQAAEQPAVKTPEKNITVAPVEPTKPEFKPVHLYYEFINTNPDGSKQKMLFDYYLDDNTICDGRPALNGFVAVKFAGQENTGYIKTTIYLDTGEAVYSDGLDANSLAFDNAKEKMADFDVAFYLPTLVARGGKIMLSEEVWNATKPVLLKSVSAFSSNGDYSLIAGEIGKMNGIECKNYTLSVKSANMQGQLLFCMHMFSNPQMVLVTDVSFPSETNAASWKLVSLDNEKSSIAYYPQCLKSISCPKLIIPTQSQYDSCNSQGKSYDTVRDSKNCVTVYECITREEQARRSIISNQQPNCQVNEEFVTQVADCWNNGGNVNYNYDPSNNNGCILSVNCNLPK